MTEDVNVKMTVDAGQSIQATNNYKKTLKELKDQMVELQVSTNGLADATEEQRAQYAALEQQAGQIADALGDVSARVKANADDFQGMSAAMEGLKGGIGALQGIVGATELLGINNTGVEKFVKTMLSLQGIMSSINAVQQVFNKDSKVRIALEKMLNTELTKNKVATLGAAAATTTFAAGEGVATTASFTLAGACKAVGVAIKNIPVIGWILAAIAALISLTKLVAGLLSDGDEGLEQQEKANEQLEQQKKHYEEVDSKIIKCASDFEQWNYILQNANKESKIYKDTLKQLENELGVSLQNQQIDTATLNKLEAIHLKVKRAELEAEFIQNQYLADRNRLQQINNVLNAAATLNHKERAAYIQDQLGVSEKIAGQYAAAIHHAKDEGSSIATQLLYDNNAASKSYQQLSDSVDGYAKKQKEANDAVLEAVAEQDSVIEAAGLKRVDADNKTTSSSKSTTKKLNKENEKREADAKKHLEAITKANSDAAKKVENYWKLYNDEIEKKNSETHEGRIDNLGREYAKTIDTLDKEYSEYETYYNNLSEEDKKALGDKLVTLEQFAAAQKKVRDKALENYVNGVKNENDAEAAKKLANQYEIEAKEQELARINGRLAGLEEGTPEYFDALIEQAEAQRDLELEQLEQDKEAKLLSEEDYQIRKKEIIDKYNTDNYESAKHYAELELQAKTETQARIGELYSAMRSFINDIQEAELADYEGNEKKQKEIKKKYAIIEAMMNIGEIGINTAKGIMGAWSAYAEIPFVGPGLAAALTAVIAVLGAVQTAAAITQLNTKIKKAARGAYVVGPSHENGGVPYELEGGEVVLNKKAMSIPAYRSIASAMNVSTGGVAFPGTSGAGLNATIPEETVASIVRQTVAGIVAIPVEVSEESITNTIRKVGVLEGHSRL